MISSKEEAVARTAKIRRPRRWVSRSDTSNGGKSAPSVYQAIVLRSLVTPPFTYVDQLEEVEI